MNIFIDEFEGTVTTLPLVWYWSSKPQFSDDLHSISFDNFQLFGFNF